MSAPSAPGEVLNMATTTSRSRKSLRDFSANRRMSDGLRKAISADDAVAFQSAFLADLARPLKRLRKQLHRSPLLALWSESAIELSGRERELAATLDEMDATSSPNRDRRKSKRRKVESPYEEILANWLVESSGILGPWETIVLAEILLREGHRLSADRFTATLGQLSNTVSHESIGGLFEGSENVAGSDDAILQMISTGERQWLCSLLLSPLHPGPSQQKTARDALEKVLTESTDTDGLVHGSLARRLPDWLAPLARCTFWSDVFEQPLWPEECESRLAAVVERASMLLLPLTHHHSEDDSPETSALSLREVLEFLLPRTQSEWQSRLQKLLKNCRKPAAAEVSRPKKLKKKPSAETAEATTAKPSKKVARPEKKKLAASWESDNSCLAILRTSLDQDADLATIEWHSSDARILLAAAGIPILTGHWNWAVRVDDEAIPAPSTWKCSCWFLDPETLFVELEGEDSASVKRVRQMLLAPHDRFAILTDSVTCKDPDKKVQLVTSIPLAEGAMCAADSVTRELSVQVGPRKVRTFPVWMEDDRIQHTLGSYREHDGQLELSGVGKGGVTLPLVLDWHPKRAASPADWARLTVTEVRRVVGSHEASGYRVRIGDHQVLIYRSLMTPKDSRAVLGLHTWDESVYSRVPSKPGQLSPLVEVESPE